MATPRRVGTENSATRAVILDAAQKVMLEEGYGAASTRRVAARAGLKPSLVHYYFPTTEDLLLALFRKGADDSDAMLHAALAAPDPLRALWQVYTDTSRMAIALEFMALAYHRPVIRAQMAEHVREMRAREVELLARLARGSGIATPDFSALGLSVVLVGIGRALIMEQGLGIDMGHAEARAWVAKLLDRIDPLQTALAGSSSGNGAARMKG